MLNGRLVHIKLFINNGVPIILATSSILIFSLQVIETLIHFPFFLISQSRSINIMYFLPSFDILFHWIERTCWVELSSLDYISLFILTLGPDIEHLVTCSNNLTIFSPFIVMPYCIECIFYTNSAHAWDVRCVQIYLGLIVSLIALNDLVFKSNHN